MRSPTSVQIAIAAAFVLMAAYAWLSHDRLDRAQERIADAEQQAEFNGEATRQVDHYTTTTTIIRREAQEAENAVRSSPGADAQLDPGNRRAVCAALERVRGSAVCVDEGAGDVP